MHVSSRFGYKLPRKRSMLLDKHRVQVVRWSAVIDLPHKASKLVMLVTVDGQSDNGHTGGVQIAAGRGVEQRKRIQASSGVPAYVGAVRPTAPQVGIPVGKAPQVRG